MQVFVTPVDGGSGNSRLGPASLDNNPPVHNPGNGEVVVSGLEVSERRAPEGQDNGLDEEPRNDSKAAAAGICICVTAVYRYAFMNTRI
jgi:hypothetical protein